MCVSVPLLLLQRSKPNFLRSHQFTTARFFLFFFCSPTAKLFAKSWRENCNDSRGRGERRHHKLFSLEGRRRRKRTLIHITDKTRLKHESIILPGLEVGLAHRVQLGSRASIRPSSRVRRASSARIPQQFCLLCLGTKLGSTPCETEAGGLCHTNRHCHGYSLF